MSERGRSFAESAEQAHRLLETWQRLGRAHMMVGGACSCGIGGVVVALEDFEQDIVDYLQAEAERHERQDVLAYMGHEARNADLWSIDKLLSSLARPAASSFYEAGGSTFLLDRLGRTLQSFEKLHGSA